MCVQVCGGVHDRACVPIQKPAEDVRCVPPDSLPDPLRQGLFLNLAGATSWLGWKQQAPAMLLLPLCLELALQAFKENTQLVTWVRWFRLQTLVLMIADQVLLAAETSQPISL